MKWLYWIVGVVALVVIGGALFVWYLPGESIPGKVQRFAQQATTNLPSCGDQDMLFTSHLVNPADYEQLDPLGVVSPPDHTFPTDHMYFQREGQDGVIDPTPVYAPADITITSISRTINKDDRPTARPKMDHSLRFQTCAEVVVFLIHIDELSEAVNQQVGWDEIKCRDEYGGTYVAASCDAWGLEIELDEGELIGYAGTSSARQSYDIGVIDYRKIPAQYANNDRWDITHTRNIACPLDYFAEPVRTEMVAKLFQTPDKDGQFPQCGTIAQDVPGTAAGNWVLEDAISPMLEQQHLALIHLASNPNKLAFSLSESFRTFGIDTGAYTFEPKESGTINREFSSVTPGNVYCYDSLQSRQSVGQGSESFHVLLSLLDSQTLDVDVVDGSSCQDSETLSDQAIRFER